jgi:ATP-dependent Clp protease protease subunit
MKNGKKSIKKFNKESEEKEISSIDLLDKRMIYLNCNIEDNSATEVIRDLLKLDSCNHKDITMYINSGGGSVSAGLAIYDIMNMIKSDIKTICVGRCASIASILLINGAKGKRFILPNAEIMIHEISSSTFGKISEVEVKFEHAKIINNRIQEIIAKKTKKLLEEIKFETDRKDTWMNSQEALKYGFVDEILR